jgi:hypothetical protein
MQSFLVFCFLGIGFLLYKGAIGKNQAIDMAVHVILLGIPIIIIFPYVMRFLVWLIELIQLLTLPSRAAKEARRRAEEEEWRIRQREDAQERARLRDREREPPYQQQYQNQQYQYQQQQYQYQQPQYQPPPPPPPPVDKRYWFNENNFDLVQRSPQMAIYTNASRTDAMPSIVQLTQLIKLRDRALGGSLSSFERLTLRGKQVLSWVPEAGIFTATITKTNERLYIMILLSTFIAAKNMAKMMNGMDPVTIAYDADGYLLPSRSGSCNYVFLVDRLALNKHPVNFKGPVGDIF